MATVITKGKGQKILTHQNGQLPVDLRMVEQILVAATVKAVQKHQEIYTTYFLIRQGKIASHIPSLVKINPIAQII